MKGFNLFELKRYKDVRVEMFGGHLRLIFPPRGAAERGVMTGYAPPPRTIETDRLLPATSHLPTPSERLFLTEDESYAAAARVLLALDRWGQAVGAAADNRRLSPNGHHELVVEATTAALTAIGAHFAALEKIQADLAKRHAELYAVPSADAGTAIVDVEARALFRALAVSDQVQLLVDATQGKQERVIAALLRGPLALADKHQRKLLDDAWAAKVRREQPQEAAELAIAEEANEWASGLTRHVASLLANPSTSGTSGGFDEFAQYKTLRAVNGVGVLEFPPQKVAMFERQIASIAA